MRQITALPTLAMTLLVTPVQAIEHYKFAVGTSQISD